jgi:hypothetical protein
MFLIGFNGLTVFELFLRHGRSPSSELSIRQRNVEAGKEA